MITKNINIILIIFLVQIHLEGGRVFKTGNDVLPLGENVIERDIHRTGLKDPLQRCTKNKCLYILSGKCCIVKDFPPDVY